MAMNVSAPKPVFNSTPSPSKTPMLTAAMQSKIDGIFGASQKMALTKATFLAYILPSLVCAYLMGVLVQLKGTRIYRLALLPILLWSTWRSIFVDMSGGDPKQAQSNTGLMTNMCAIAMRGIIWAFAQEPFRRQSHLDKHDKSAPTSIFTALWNAWDLQVAPRGVGWNWRQRFIIPKPTFETDSRVVFVLLSMGRLAFYALAMDGCIQATRMLSPNGFGSLDGGSLFDHTLPLHLEILRAVWVSFLTVWMAYFAMDGAYHLQAIIFIILFQQRPSQWPPLFNSPWLSTSLTELWGRRWHQMLRQLVVWYGFRPFGYLLGPLGGILGAFLVSGLFHDMELRSIGRGGNLVVVLTFWMMNGVGVVLERVWKRMTGRRVGGVLGWMWTFGWLALWGVWLVDAWARIGRFGVMALPGEIEPSVALVGFVRRYLLA